MNNLLAPPKTALKIVRLSESDAKHQSDHIVNFSKLVLANETMYPGIDKWLKNKVIPGLKASERVAYIGYENENPIVTAVVKHGGDSKFCHLRINDDFQNEHLGELFFSLMALEVRNEARDIHFTLPESLWSKKHDFFKSFGFKEIAKAGTQYRIFDQELRCSAPFHEVWKAVIDKIPKLINNYTIGGYSLHNGLILSIKPEYAQNVLEGKKTVEIRRKFAKKWIGHKAALYASGDKKALVGEATIFDVVAASPSQIWKLYGHEIGCSKDDFDNYTSMGYQVYAIVLSDIQPYNSYIPITQISHLIHKDLTPPQSYFTLEKNKPWAEAVSIASLLQGRFNPRRNQLLHLF